MHNQKHQIAIIHAQLEDISLLNSLIIDEPFELVTYDDVHSIADKQFESDVSASATLNTYGVILCASDAEANSSDLSKADQENSIVYDLAQLNGRYPRILVLSDSIDENTICEYLIAGAHHVLPMTDSPRLMRARVLAGLRQHSEPLQQEWHIGPYHFDLLRRTVMIDDENLRLSPREFELARYLFERRGRVVPIAEILTSVWSLPENADSRRIDTAACRLRKKMKLDQTGSWQLRRLRREGYQLVRLNEVG